ncbi:MAG: hypothetical protein QOJ29_3234, partial [Thermoleophilaceae bacterium]|nr:hypothetical protein [Thermoleophilaceae bacterium]
MRKLTDRLAEAEPSWFGVRDDDPTVAGELLNGVLRISPHAPATIPDDPRWDENPVGDDNWQVRYLALNWVDPLRREYLRTSDTAMLERYEFLLHDFADDNPAFEDARTDWTWFDHPTGHRASTLAIAAGTLGLPDWLEQAMRTHADVIARPDQYHGKGNHSLMQNSGLLSIGLVLEDKDLIDLALERSEKLLVQSIDAEGVSDEGSYSYQWSNYRWWSEMRAKCIAGDITLTPAWDRIEKMPAFTAHATQPTGRATPFGDTNADAPGVRVPTKPELTTAFYGRGYLFSRSGWGTERPVEEESMVSLRYRQPFDEQVHGHMDAGNIEFFAYGRPLIT